MLVLISSTQLFLLIAAALWWATITPSFGNDDGFLSAARLLSCLLSKQTDAMLAARSVTIENAEACPGFQDIRFFSGCENPNGKNDELTSAEPVKEEGECLDETVRHSPDRLYQ